MPLMYFIRQGWNNINRTILVISVTTREKNCSILQKFSKTLFTMAYACVPLYVLPAFVRKLDTAKNHEELGKR